MFLDINIYLETKLPIDIRIIKLPTRKLPKLHSCFDEVTYFLRYVRCKQLKNNKVGPPGIVFEKVWFKEKNMELIIQA